MKVLFPKLVLACLLVFGSLNLQAQQKTPFSQKLHFGIKGTALASKYEFVPSVAQNIYIGAGGGVLARFDVERGASLQMELNYTLTGWKEKYDKYPNLHYVRSIHTVNLPILTHLYLSFGKGARLFLNLGPVIGYHFAEDGKFLNELTIEKPNFSSIANYRHDTSIEHKFFWGLCGGPGVSIPLGTKHRLELEGRYTFGLGDIWSNKRKDPYGNSAERRYSFSIAYCYSL